MAKPLSYAEVHECVWEETKTPLLVYASEQAMSEEATPLSNHLERFAKADNKAFRQELNQEMADPAAEEAGATNPRSPKRKRWADSPDSMATDRASAGSEVGEEVHEIFGDSSTEEGMAEFERMQKRTYGEHSRDMMDLDVSEKAPPLPQRHSVSTENTLTTLTPTTLAAGEGTSSGSPETRQTTPPGSGEATGESAPDESKGPEMQERPRTPTFRRYLISENPEAKTSEPEDMDM